MHSDCVLGSFSWSPNYNSNGNVGGKSKNYFIERRFVGITISKEINCAEHEYMNMSPSLIALAMPLPSTYPSNAFLQYE